MSIVAINRRFPVDDRPNAVQVNVVANDGRDWINVMNVRSFGLRSSNWTGRDHSRRKQGLKRQAEKLLRSATQNRLHDGVVPRVIFSFAQVVTDEVASALRGMGCVVRGAEISLTPERLPVCLAQLPFAHTGSLEQDGKRFAMWWRGEEKGLRALLGRSTFKHSPTRSEISRAYRQMDGVESELFTFVLRGLGAVSPRSPRVELPADLLTVPVVGGDGYQFLFSASAEKGCRLHFDLATAAKWRDQMWTHFAEYVAQCRSVLGTSPGRGTGARGWWEACESAAISDKAEIVGMVLGAN